MKKNGKILRYVVIAAAVALYLVFFIRNNFLKKQDEVFIVDKELVYEFPGLTGPAAPSVLPAKKVSSWKTHHHFDSHYGIGILLTDTNSCWLGLVHGFKSFGIPFNLYTNVDSALRHQVVLVYPVISGKVLDGASLKKLSEFPVKGGTLIGINVLGGIIDEFGIGEAVPSLRRFKIQLKDKSSPLLSQFKEAREQEISLGNPVDFRKIFGTHGYRHPLTAPLLVYETGEACLTQYYYKGKGRAFALGFDLGEFILRSQDERGYNAQRSYVNDYEPSVDVLIRILKNIYSTATDEAVFVHTVPGNYDLAVCITHDIDFTRSIVHAVDYAKLEKSKGIKATYFIQTKYIKDWNDDVFFNQRGTECLNNIAAMDMEIGSHSVSHSYVFSKFPIGTGKETYPSYTPFVVGRDSIRNGSILGELRVSKFLLESFAPQAEVRSFRSGHLSYPFSLPQALEAAGFQYSSCITANNALTHLPYQMMYDRGFDSEMNLFEFPVTIEDEKPPRLDLRLLAALTLSQQLGKEGGFMNVLIHTDTLDYKLAFETALIDSLKSKAWFGTLGEYASWWKYRNEVRINVEKQNKEYVLTVIAPGTVQDLAFEIPSSWKCLSQNSDILFVKNRLLIRKFEKKINIRFSSQP